MIKRIMLAIALLAITATNYAQDVKKEAELVKTKMDIFTSKTGAITKFVDTKLPTLKTSYGGAETRIRKVSNSVSTAFFYQIEKQGKYSSSTASIEYSDMLEVLKALKALKVEISNDIASNPDYLENKFITVDGFQVGYYVSNSKAIWFIKLEKYGSDNTIFLDNGDAIENALTEAKNKIDELKK
jgi:hypothetical protein